MLIILDDVDDLEKLEALANELSWFGFGSRIIVTTKDKQILKTHGIKNIYRVDLPSREDALEILCLSAFKQSFVQDGFEEVAKEVAMLCGNLPLALRVVGSSLGEESKDEWERQLSRIKISLDSKIEDVLVVGYERLSKKDQSLFLHVACIFNHDEVDRVTTVLADSNLDVENGLKTLSVIGLHSLSILNITNCRKLVSLQSLLPSLLFVKAYDCVSLKSVTFDETKDYITLTHRNCLKLEEEAIRVTPSLDPIRYTMVSFSNCLKLDEEARRGIIQRWGYKSLLLPGKEIPAQFTHKATGNSITISSENFSTSSRFKACLLLSPILFRQDIIRCSLRSKGVLINEIKFEGPLRASEHTLTEQHLFMLYGDLFKEDKGLEVHTTTSEIQFEFSCMGDDDERIDYKIIECGVEILEEEDEGSSSKQKEQNDGAVQMYKDESVGKSSKHTGWWNWLRKLGLRKKKTV